VSSVHLFHGPGARNAAISEATSTGRLVAPPFGDDGLKVGDAREIVELAMSDPVGEKIGFIVVGPIDNAKNEKAMDALLKTVEEPPTPYTRIILWADDYGGVRETIRSRCLGIWAPGDLKSDKEMIELARRVISETLRGNYYLLSTLLEGAREGGGDPDPDNSRDGEGRIKKKRFRGIDLLWAMADVLAEDLDDPANLRMWDRIRKIALWGRPPNAPPTIVEVVSVLVS